MQRRKHVKKFNSVIVVVVFLLGIYNIQKLSFQNEANIVTSDSLSFGAPLRKLLWKSTGNYTINNDSHRCNEPSIKEFPSDVFSQHQRRNGAVLLHFFMALYMFVALAFVCDDYFISALDKICERLDLSEDVAGATFMAAGSSAPELFTSLIGVFVAKGDVGVGTIVGSAVFNILVIIAICGLFAGQVVYLTWWSLFRDSMYYMLSVAALIWVLFDGKVTWYESLVMLSMYIGYIVLMKCNPLIVNKLNARTERNEMIRRRKIDEENLVLDHDEKLKVKFKNNSQGSYQAINLIETNKRKVTWKELGMMIMLSDQFSPSTRFRAACLIVILRGDHKKIGDEVNDEKYENHIDKSSYQYQQNGEAVTTCEDATEVTQNEIEGTPFLHPQGSVLRSMFWIASLPLVTVLYFTVPDCRKPRWETWYIVTFLMSIFWIGVFSYILVWMVCLIGFTFGIPDVIMGITFLAAGTSIPDAISSLLVAREGQGDMAVSNSIGSNVFDILIGLAVPWFIKTAIVSPGTNIVINSRGMIYSVSLLFASVVVTVLVIHFNKWKLDKKAGAIFLVLYAIFLSISACIEFNLFGFVNFPTCAFEG